MKKIKIGLIALCFLIVCGMAATSKIYADDTENPLEGKIIALDAGHGGDDPGAINKTYNITEADVNLAVVYELKRMLELNGADVVLTREEDETIISRRDRVAIAEQKCAELGGECDVLVSVHHNGSDDPEHDGTMVIYNERPEKSLAISLHDALIDEFKLADEGYENGGYGMTVFFTPATITEAYYITNDWEAQQHLNVDDNDDNNNGVIDRVEEEANALYSGLSGYFLNNEPSHPGKRNQ